MSRLRPWLTWLSSSSIDQAGATCHQLQLSGVAGCEGLHAWPRPYRPVVAFTGPSLHGNAVWSPLKVYGQRAGTESTRSALTPRMLKPSERTMWLRAMTELTSEPKTCTDPASMIVFSCLHAAQCHWQSR